MNLALLATTAKPTFYLVRYFILNSHISAETVLTKPMIPSHHFRGENYWHSAHLRRDTPPELYSRQPYPFAKLLPPRLLSMVQLVSSTAMAQVALQLSIYTCPPMLNNETLIIRNMRWIVHAWTELGCTYTQVRSTYTILYSAFKRRVFIPSKPQLYFARFSIATAPTWIC